MTRKTFFACLLGVFYLPAAHAQSAQSSPAKQDQATAPAPPDEDQPPEEDEVVKPRVYAFNPLEAERSIRVGEFYMHQATSRGYRAAAGRFEEATRFNPNSAEAFFRLGEAELKLKNKDKARAAFEKAAQVGPDTKFGKEAKKKLQAA